YTVSFQFDVLEDALLKTDEYLQLLFEGKMDEAKNVRLSTIPDKLIKFIWLDGSKTDDKKFLSLERNEIWFAQKDFLNDPYEYKGMLLDRQKMSEAGYPADIIDYYQTIFDFSDYGITCLSSNNIDYLPMWAYYTNNHKGFCVEYEVIKKDCIHEVLYEPERIKVASLILQSREAIKKAINLGQREQADFYLTLFLQNLFIKAKSWEHEKEYRIVYPLNNNVGMNVPVNKLGMRTSRIVAGINCSENDVIRLNEISNELGLGNVYKSRVHPEKYTIDYVR
ncbi:MAG: DUF2971 domain-containing protein, partial [Lachnospiraceae bacterium]|nr:DUF2971 domain-containing protein [Lachnospiraceae bacterium]